MKYNKFASKMIVSIAIVFFSWQSSASLSFTAKAGKEELNLVMQDGLTLRALVQKPSGEGPFPMVIVIHGSAMRGTLVQREIKKRHEV